MSRTQTVTITRLTAGSVFKIQFIGLAGVLLPLSLVEGILASFGFDSLVWNGVYLHGITALLVGPLLGLALAVMLTLAAAPISCLGLWLYSRWRPLRLKVIVLPDPEPVATP